MINFVLLFVVGNPGLGGFYVDFMQTLYSNLETKIPKEIKAGLEKERILSAEDALLINQLINKIQKGFTLVEVLIVVIIVGILATVAIPTYFEYVKKGYASDAKVQLKNILMNRS